MHGPAPILNKPLNEPRRRFRQLLQGDQPIFAPLCLDALTARIASACGFGAGYVSGGALGYAMAVSEALLTLTEVALVTQQVVRRTDLPIIVDAGVGFGDAVHGARTIWEIEATGAAAIEIEDQVAPKRVSHHRGIEHLVSCATMTAKIEQAALARRDPDLLIIARTGAVKNESFDAAIERARAYRSAGADLIMLMPADDVQWQRAAELIDAPLATIAALDSRSAAQWREWGWRLIIDPFTAQVLSVQTIRRAYAQFQATGSTGHAPRELFDIYRELPGLAGLEALYHIEDQTTERGEEK
jgi:2-methylisocitrate lyase-like PEP mutase family enzyme